MEKVDGANSRQYRFLDLSGFIVSGKRAYSDLVQEFTGYAVPPPEFEFELIRIQGGIRDLESALVTDWSPLRADAAIRRFQVLIQRLGARNQLFKPSTWFSAAGWDYDQLFRGEFFSRSDAYLRELILATWTTNWPYPRSGLCDHELFSRKIAAKLGIKSAMDFEINLAGSRGFLESTRQYLEGLLGTLARGDTTTVVTQNAFEPFNPLRATRYFHRSQCIVVDRDPRDSYVAMAPFRHLALGVDEFIARFRLYREQIVGDSDEAGVVLRTRFEDLILDYDATVTRILAFLGEDSAVHQNKRHYFDPSQSAKNVGTWKTYPKQGEIDLIRRELKDYCDPRVD